MNERNGTIKSYIKRAAAAAAVLCALVLASCGSFAWFEKEKNSEVTVDFGSMEIASEVYFQTSSDEYRPGTDAYGFYEVKIRQEDSGEYNYLGNVRINVFFKGIGANYIRVYIAEQRVQTVNGIEYIQRSVFTRYIHNDALWIDARRGVEGQTDAGYYYYHNPSSPFADKYEISHKPGADYMTIALITGVEQSFLDALYPLEGETLKIKVLSEAVQINRFAEIWEIDALPPRT